MRSASIPRSAVSDSWVVRSPNHWAVRVNMEHREGSKGLEVAVDVKAAARFLGVSSSLVYAYVERKQIPHYRMMGRCIRFNISELEKWRQKFFVNGGVDE